MRDDFYDDHEQGGMEPRRFERYLDDGLEHDGEASECEQPVCNRYDQELAISLPSPGQSGQDAESEPHQEDPEVEEPTDAVRISHFVHTTYNHPPR